MKPAPRAHVTVNVLNGTNVYRLATRNAHQLKKLGEDALKAVRDRYRIPVADDQLADPPFYRPPEGSRELEYLHARRKELGGYLPERRASAKPLPAPELSEFDTLLKGSGDREMSTTMAYVRLLGLLLRNKQLADRIVPIVPDEARTFGMEGLFRQLGIYAAKGSQRT